MTSAISSALSGLQSATQRINTAADKIVKNSGEDSINLEFKSKSAPEVIPSGFPIRASFNPLSDLASGIIDLKTAETSYKASAKVIAAALEIDKNLIDQIT